MPCETDNVINSRIVPQTPHISWESWGGHKMACKSSNLSSFDKTINVHIDGLVHDCSNSSALAMELRLFCIKSSTSEFPINLVISHMGYFLSETTHTRNSTFPKQTQKVVFKFKISICNFMGCIIGWLGMSRLNSIIFRSRVCSVCSRVCSCLNPVQFEKCDVKLTYKLRQKNE